MRCTDGWIRSKRCWEHCRAASTSSCATSLPFSTSQSWCPVNTPPRVSPMCIFTSALLHVSLYLLSLPLPFFMYLCFTYLYLCPSSCISVPPIFTSALLHVSLYHLSLPLPFFMYLCTSYLYLCPSCISVPPIFTSALLHVSLYHLI